jgi:hypothetical protein
MPSLQKMPGPNGRVWHESCMVEIAMSTRDKIEAYFAATTKVTRVAGRVFNLSDLRHCLQWERAECDMLTTHLEKAGLLNRLPNDEAILTTAGRKRVEELDGNT